jgi:hypothetical protein
MPADSDVFMLDAGGVTKKVSAANVKLDCLRVISSTVTVGNSVNFALNTATGTKIGTGTTQKLGFYNATPVTQRPLTDDLLDSLQATGLVASGSGNTPLNLTSGALTCGAINAASVASSGVLSCTAATVSSLVSSGTLACTAATVSSLVSSGTLACTSATVSSLASSGAVTSSSPTAGLGYATGAGSTATQSTSRTTGVTLSRPCGSITLFGTTTTAGQTTAFTVTNTCVAATDVVVVSQQTGSGVYFCSAKSAAGSFVVSVYTPAAVATSDAPVLNFVVIKAVAA